MDTQPKHEYVIESKQFFTASKVKSPYRRAFMSRGRVAPPEPSGSERRLESFMNHAG